MTQKSVLQKKQEDLNLEVLDRDSITRILGAVAYDRAFFFYEDVGKPTCDFSTNLLDLCGKINTAAPASLSFHLKRGDFENWIRDVMGDSELADRIGKLKALKTIWKSEKTLRRKLSAVVRDRVTELQDLQRHVLTRPDSGIP